MDQAVTERRSLSPMKRLRVFEAAAGVCWICEQRIQAGQKWEVEHKRALALGGADDASNMAPAHVVCHSEKTKTDNASWTKAKRTKARFLGIPKTRNPMPGSKASRWRKPFNGPAVLR